MSFASEKIRTLFRFGAIAVAALLPAIVPAYAATAIRTSVMVSVVPNAPSSLTASASSNSQIYLSWTNNADNETGFTVERSTGNDTNFAAVATVPAGVTVYTDGNLTAGTAYFYRVNAYDADGASAYSNEGSATTSPAPLPPAPPSPPSPPSVVSGGGGGGGGGGYSYTPTPVASQTSVIFRGMAYPLSNISLLENGQVVAVTQSGPDARFEIDLGNLAEGNYNFSISAMDASGNRSPAQTFQIFMTPGATTIVSGIFFPPTINEDLLSVKKGNILSLFGYTAPTSMVTIVVHSDNPIVATTTANDAGVWQYQLATDDLVLGDHTVMVRAANQIGGITEDSIALGFMVGTEDIAAPSSTPACPARGDLNGDCRVNLVDFSIMAYWYGRPNPPASVLFDNTSAVDLTDFSILAYYWTG